MPSETNDDPEIIKQIKADAFTHTVDLNDLKSQAKPPSGHTWIKQGPHLVCHSCPTEHAHFVGHDFDTRHLSLKMTRPGAAHPNVAPAGAIIPKASTEPKRGRKKKGQ